MADSVNTALNYFSIYYFSTDDNTAFPSSEIQVSQQTFAGLEDVLKTCLEDVLKTYLKDVLKTCLDTYWGCLYLTNLNVYLTNLYLTNNLHLTILRQIQNALSRAHHFNICLILELNQHLYSRIKISNDV